MPSSGDPAYGNFCFEFGEPLASTGGRALAAAESILRGELQILGRSLSLGDSPIPWDRDFHTQGAWPSRYHKLMGPHVPSPALGDIKVPWELSRFQHFGALAEAFWHDKDGALVSQAVDQVDDWMSRNPFPYGVNWTCAMEVAIRACNWILAWAAFRHDARWTSGFHRRFLAGLWQHGIFIEDNLEDWEVRTNHYLGDIVGLLFLGTLFPFYPESKRWKRLALRELTRCMVEMVHDDGVSFENSTAYHRLVLEFFTYSAVLCRKNSLILPRVYHSRLEKMYEFVLQSMRPDGLMPMIGDCDDGRLFILGDYFDWNRWDYRYLLSVGGLFFERADFTAAAGEPSQEAFWLLGRNPIHPHRPS